ncbi:MAG: hypothetical protein ACRD50_08030 [Candidatus Acidiferrales bacterium]
MHSPSLLGLVGTIVVLAGLDLLWQSRHELLYWTKKWIEIFRRSLHGPARFLPTEDSSFERHHILRLLLGMSLVFLIGPALIVLSRIL